MLRVQLLGGFRLQGGDETAAPLTIPRLQSLLAYVILQRDAPLLRRQLAFVFWPDSTESQAHTNLRRELHQLRRRLPWIEQYLDIRTQSIHWRADPPCRIDVDEFERLCAQAAAATAAEQAHALYAEAVALYRGPLLPGGYDEWVLARREALAHQYGRALDRLIHLAESRRDYATAVEYAQRLLRHDPLAETTYQHLMRLHALRGDRAGALQVFHECTDVLARELGVEPSAATCAAYAQLLHADAPQPQPLLSQPVKRPRHGDAPPVLVGRQAEWQRLRELWQTASQGPAQVVTLTGEAGIGKTWLAEAVVSWVSRQGLRAAMARAYDAEGGLAFTPLIDLLRTPSLTPGLTALKDVWLAHVARLLPEVLEGRPHVAPPEPVSDPWQRQQFFEALARAVLGDGQPLLLVLDDLQWCDRETLDWLRYLLHYARQAKLLLVLTLRTGEVAADHPAHAFILNLRRDQHVHELALDRLTAADTAALAEHIAGRALEPERAAALFRQTAGNPLFVAEMVRAEVSDWAAGRSGEGPATDAATDPLAASPVISVPRRVQAVIQARLARLEPPAQELIWLAAAVGRSFRLDVVAHAGAYAEEQLVHDLEELWRRDLLREQSLNTYDFSHPLIREVAYGQIPPLRRRLYHRRVAQALEQVYALALDAMSGAVATQYELSGEAEQAVRFYQQAARFSKQAYAYAEAVDHLRRGLVLLLTLPDGPARRRQELEFQLDLGWALMMQTSWANPAAEQAYARALSLCQHAAPDAHLYEAIWGLHEIYLFQGHFAQAREACDHCWRLAHASGDPHLLLAAHHAYWGLNFYAYPGSDGVHAALDHAQQGITLYDPAWHQRHVLHQAGHDPGMCAHAIKARVQWLLGYPVQAVETAWAGVDLATRLGHPFSLVQAYLQTAKVHGFCGEPHRVLACLAQVRQIAAEQKWPEDDPQALILQGWAQGQIEPSAAAAALAGQGVQSWRDKGIRVELPFFLALWAETQHRAGQLAAASQTITEALQVAQSTGEDYYRPELWRLHGCFLQAGGDHAAAHASLEQALQVARAQRVRSLELRAALSLSQLWVAQGQRGQAYEFLAGVYAWFTEGFGSRDLQAAKELLLTLSLP